MHRNEMDPTRSPDIIGETVIRSHKNINISGQYHAKTETDRDDDYHASPDMGRSEMRDTWRRPKIPYNKLPEVFSQQKQKKKYSGKIRHDMLRNIDKMVENSQYKETQKYLQPLLRIKEDQKKKQYSENRNPLNPIKKIIKLAMERKQQIKDMQDLSLQMLKNRSGPKISQCIYLQVIKRSHNKGQLKKMLHIPTLTFTCVRVEPYTLKESRNAIRDWTNIWREKLSGQNMPFVTVHDVLYNYPEGALSVFMDYFKSGSLLNLLDLTATLSESVIRQIFLQVLEALDIFYETTNLHFGGLSPSQIMFTDDNHVRLSLGVFYHILGSDSQNPYYMKAIQKNSILDFNTSISKFNKLTGQKNNVDNQKSMDIFKFGLCMLQCSIGSFQNYEQSSIIFEALKYIFTQKGQRIADNQNLCCLIHSQNQIIQLFQNESERDKNSKKNEQKYISYIKLLKERFSIQFINCLCQCLKLHHGRRATFQELMNHSFITNLHQNQNRTVKVDLSNMLQIGRGLNSKSFQSNSQQKIKNFLSQIQSVMMNTNKDSLKQLLTFHQDKIYSVGKQVGFNSQIIGSKIDKMLVEIIKNTK